MESKPIIRVLFDKRIILDHSNVRPTFSEPVEQLITAIKSSQGKIEGYMWREDILSLWNYINRFRDEYRGEFDEFANSINFIHSIRIPNNAREKFSLLRLNDPEDVILLGSFLKFNEINSKKINYIVTFNPQNFPGHDNYIKSVKNFIEEFSLTDNSEEIKKEKIKKIEDIFKLDSAIKPDHLNQENSVTSVHKMSRINAAMRAYETIRNDRLFKDDLAWLLAGSEARSIVWGRLCNGDRPYVPVRTRFIDDGLMNVVSRENISQILMLGAGMDTRAFRLDLPSNTTIFEVDHADVLDYKQNLITDADAVKKCERKLIRHDLTQPYLKNKLEDEGYKSTEPVIIVMEGFQMYLFEDQMYTLLENISQFSASGSYLFADLINKKAWLENSMFFPWKSGFDDPEKLFSDYGWHVTVKQPSDEDINCNRYIQKLPPRNVPDIERAFLCMAVKSGKYQDSTETLSEFDNNESF